MVSAHSYWRSSAPIALLALAACASAQPGLASRAASAAPGSIRVVCWNRSDTFPQRSMRISLIGSSPPQRLLGYSTN